MGELVRSGIKYSLAIIGRGNPEEVDTCLSSYARFPDEVVFVNTGIDETEAGFKEVNAVAEKHGARVLHFPWVDDFSAARNFSFANCTHPYVMWLDTDDTVEHPELCDLNIRRALGEGADCIYMEYLYERDSAGNWTAVQKRERVVTKDCFEWRAPIHEVLCAVRQVSPTTMPAEISRIVHNRKLDDIDRQRASQRRNLKVFRTQFEEKGIEPELRMLFYWGNTLIGLGDNKGAIEKYERYIKRSEQEGNGNEAEVMQACVGLAEAYCNLGDLDNSERVSLYGISKMPHTPTPYFCLARVAFERRDWVRVAHFARRTLECQDAMDAMLVANPRELVGRSYWFLAMAAAATGEAGIALENAEKAEKWFATNPIFKEFIFNVRNEVKRRNLLASWANVRNQLILAGRVDDAAAMAQYAPEAISDDQIVRGVGSKARPKDKPSLAILCPSHPHIKPWGPWSIGEGIGGSEEAVINMSRELAARGWHVEVYCNTGRPCANGPYHDPATGVLWYRDAAWSGKFDSQIDVAISWRSPPAFRVMGSNAAQHYCWLHDIPNPSAWAPGQEDEYDGVFVLSKFHRKLFSFLPEKSIRYSENGLDERLFVPLDDLKNEPHRLVWGSDPSRGLQYLLPWWGYIREKVPDATLDVFYGWTNIYLEHMKQDRSMQDIHDQIERLREQPGITWHGMVGHDKLAAAYASSGVWPYMTTFPEIHCITALKIQAHGCLPVTVDDFALSETVQYGDKLPGPMSDQGRQKAMVDRIIERMLNPPTREERLEMARWARSKTWGSVAEHWDALFRSRLSTTTTAPSLVRSSA